MSHDPESRDAAMQAKAPPSPDSLASLELRLREHLDTRINSELERDRELIRNATTLGTRLITVAAGALTLLLAILGLRTANDIRAVSRSAAIAEVKRSLSIGDPDAPFRHDVDALVGSAIVDAYRVHLTRLRLYPDDSNKPILTGPEVERLRALLLRPDTPLAVFSDAADVVSTFGSPEAVHATATALGTAVVKSGHGMFSNGLADPQHVRALLTSFSTRDLVPLALWVLNDTSDEGARVDALAFLAKVGARDDAVRASQHLLSASASTRERDAAVGALLRVDPSNPAATKALADATNGVSEPEGLIRLALYASAVADGQDDSGIFPNSVDEARRAGLLKALFATFVRAGSGFTVERGYNGGRYLSFVAHSAGASRETVSLAQALVRKRCTDIAITNLIREAWRSGRANSMQPVISTLARVPQRHADRAPTVLMRVTGNAWVATTAGDTLRTSSTRDDFALWTVEGSRDINILWHDARGTEHTSIVDAMGGLAEAGFSWAYEGELIDFEGQVGRGMTLHS